MKKYNIIILSATIIITILSLMIAYKLGESHSRIIDKSNYNKEIVITNQYINVRDCASKTCENIGRVYASQKYIALQKIDATATYDWYKIEYSEGEYGWIASDKVEPYVKEK